MIHEFKAQITESAAGSLTALIAPFGVSVPYGRTTVEFAAGGIHVPNTPIALTVDHDSGVLSAIGVMTRSVESDAGLYADFQLADTEAGRDVRELLKLGAVTDVSVGIELSEDFDGGVMSGTLDHVSVVQTGRFQSAEVLSVHDEKEPQVAETTVETTASVVETVVEKFDDTEIKTAIAEMADKVDVLAAGKPVAEFSAIEMYTAMVAKGAGLEVSNHALADVIGDLGSADASGIVPASYWGAGLQMKIDRRRPVVATAGSAPFPAAGNSLEVPKETQATLVAVRGAEKGAVNSRAWQAVVNSFPLVWYDGAVDISYEILSQSDPSVLQVVMASLLNQYAVASETSVAGVATAAATHTGGGLDTATYAGLVADIITTSDLIEDATGLPGDFLGVTSAQWIAILSLMDGGDRRQFAMINPQNADGSGSLLTRGIDVGGVFIFRAPTIGFALQYNQSSFKVGEKSPMTVAAENVELMGRDLGILASTVTVTWPEGIYTYEV